MLAATRTRLVLALGLVLTMIVASAGPVSAYQRPGQTERMSVPSGPGEGAGDSSAPSMSADGRYVAFVSAASNLVDGDTNDFRDVFVHDRKTGETERVSVASDGTEGNGDSLRPAISADGRYVGFDSAASNLVDGDTNDFRDVFVHDRKTGETERVSVSSEGEEGEEVVISGGVFPGDSASASISADGRYVAFHSLAPNFVPDDTNLSVDVFVHHRQTAVTERVSVASDGTQGQGSSFAASISADGRYVAFDSFAENLVASDSNGVPDVFVHDRQTAETELVSVTDDGTQGNGASWQPAISADGGHVAFASIASNLVPTDTNGRLDVFVRDRETGSTERVSIGSDGTEGDANAISPSISADGRYVAFQTPASNLAADDNGVQDIFVHDRQARATERVSVTGDGAPGDDHAQSTAITADGRHVAFDSAASNLVPGDTNEARDVFVRDRGAELEVGGLSAVLQGDEIAVSGWATFSGQLLTTGAASPDGGAPGARELGAELTGASVHHRPEQEDLLISLRLASLPDQPFDEAPAVLYGLGFDLAGTAYEVRMAPAGLTTDEPHFALYRCDPDCVEHTSLTGGIGTTGAEILVSVPLAALGSPQGESLQGARAYTALGDAAHGPLATLDEVDLPDATPPVPRVSLGIAAADSAEEAVDFDVEATLADGVFSGAVEAVSAPEGDRAVWARACLGEVCEALSVLVTPPPGA